MGREQKLLKGRFNSGRIFELLVLSLGLVLTLGGLCFGQYDTVTLTNSQDSYINVFGPDSNYDSSDSIRLDRQRRSQGVIKFDLSSIPANSDVSEAKIRLFANGGDSDTLPRIVRFSEIIRTWDVTDVTYNEADSGVAWNSPGLEEGTDFSNYETGTVTVSTLGIWYELDITELVSKWVSYPATNTGLLIYDTGGYEPGNMVKRFASSENADTEIRPQLMLTYNASTPAARAGTDYENIDFALGSPISLDGSSSSDPVEPADDLIYSWHFLETAYGSILEDEDISPNNTTGAAGADTPQFTPDKLGTYKLRLTVSNGSGYSNSDDVQVKILYFPPHPRILLTSDDITRLKAAAAAETPEFLRWKGYIETYPDSASTKDHALMYIVTDDEAYGQMAISAMYSIINRGIQTNLDKSTWVEAVAIGYDWCYDILTPAQRTETINYMNAQVTEFENAYLTAWHNYATGTLLTAGMVGLATFGENDMAPYWINHARVVRWEDLIKPALDFACRGGAWPEGTPYSMNTVYRMCRYAQATKTATGEDIFRSSGFFYDRMVYDLFMYYPGIKQLYGNYYHEFNRRGDGLRGLRGYQNYARAAEVMLANNFKGDPVAQMLQWHLNIEPANKTPHSWMAIQDFLWYDPTAPASPPVMTSHHATGLGTVLMRSDWNDDATWASFQCGDHYEYHQHLDQNSFTIFKGEDLAVDSGNYDGYGSSAHAINYHKRSIAHNTILAYNPSETFRSIVGGVDGDNDGGQRTMYPNSIQIGSVQSFVEKSYSYETGDMKHYYSGDDFVYSFGDATAAYNNPQFHQGDENVAKVSNFTRQFLYLKPDVFVVYDRFSTLDAGFTKKWLLHPRGNPQVTGSESVISTGEYLYDGDSFSFEYGDGALFGKTILPANHKIRKVGGKGVKDYWVYGTNYPAPTGDENDYTEWRLEVEPGLIQKNDQFLHVLYTAPAGTPSMPEANRISIVSGAVDGTSVSNKFVLFARDENKYSYVKYTADGSGSTRHYLMDLQPNKTFKVTAHPQAGGSDIVIDNLKYTYFTGRSSVLKPAELIDDTADYIPGSLVGMELLPYDNSPQTYTITANTATEIFVDPADGYLKELARAGDVYRIGSPVFVFDLNINGTYDIEVIESGGGGTTSDSAPPAWTNGIGLQDLAIGTEEATLYWNTALDAESPPVKYNVYQTQALPFDIGSAVKLADVTPTASGGYDYEYTVSGLTGSTPYYFIVRAEDSADTSNEDSNTIYKTYNPGSPAPIISSVSPTSINNDQANAELIITGSNFAAGFSAGLSLNGGGTDLPAADTSYIGANSVMTWFNIDGLLPGSYDLRLTNSDSQYDILANAVTVEDVQPPVFAGLTGMSAVVEGFDLSWSAASDDSPPITYNIFISNTSMTYNFMSPDYSTTETSFTIGGLDPALEYFVIVRADDNLGNKNENTAELSGYPDEVPPPAPVLTDINPADGFDDQPVTVSLTGSDLETGATATLERAGLTLADASSVNIISSTSAEADFDLTGLPSGLCDVRLTNPDTQSFLLSDAFTIKLSSGGGVQVLTLANGLDSYTGTIDATIDIFNKDNNYSATDNLYIERQRYRQAVVKFDLSGIPPGTDVQDAKIRLYAIGGSTSGERTTRLYSVLKTWQETEVTYSQAYNGSPWDSEGLGKGTDISSLESASAVIGALNTWYEMDVTALVSGWVNTPGDNHGFLISDEDGYDGGNNVRSFASSDHADTAIRPQLVITYDGGGEPLPDTAPPDWPNGTGLLVLDGTADAATVSWNAAVDSDTAPVKYNLYYSQVSPLDFGTAIKLADITPETGSGYDYQYSVNGLSGYDPYYFAIRAEDSADPANEDANSVTMTYEPSYSAPIVTTVGPVNGLYGETISPVTVNGADFLDGAVFGLSIGGTFVLEASGITWISAGQLTGDLDLTDLEAGTYDIKVTNPDDKSGFLADAFTISYPAPDLASVSPDTGISGETVPVTVSGTNFLDGSLIVLEDGGSAVADAQNVIFISGTEMTADIDLAGLSAGTYDLRITNPDTQTDMIPDAFTVTNPILTVSSVDPDSGISGETVSVTVSGNDFLEGAVIVLEDGGSVVADAQNITFNSGSELTADINLAGVAVGVYDLRVTNPDTQYAVLADSFTVGNPAPTLLSMDPASAVSGDTVSLSIKGTGFLDGLKIKLTDGAATHEAVSVVVSDSQNASGQIDLGGAEAGVFDLVIENTDGQTADLQDAFTVEYQQISLISINPLTGMNNELVAFSITGTNFFEGLQIWISDSSSTYMVEDIVITDSENASGSLNLIGAFAGSYDVIAENIDGNFDILNEAFNVCEDEAPVVTSINPETILNNTTTQLTISGACFATEATVRLVRNGYAPVNITSINVLDGNNIQADIDGGSLDTGEWQVVVFNPDTQFGTYSGSLTVVNPPPDITSISPPKVDTGIETEVSINGSGFLAGASVTLQQNQTSLELTEVLVESGSLIKVTVNFTTDNEGVWDLILTNTDDQSVTVPSGFSIGSPDVRLDELEIIDRETH